MFLLGRTTLDAYYIKEDWLYEYFTLCIQATPSSLNEELVRTLISRTSIEMIVNEYK